MKILHVIPAVASRYGGPSAVLPQMCRALAQHGVETTIAATDADGDGRLDVPLGTTTTYEGTPAIFFSRTMLRVVQYSKPLAAWLMRSVDSFDLVHVHAVLSHACLAAGRACRATGVPYVVRPLGTLDPWSLGQKALKKQVLLWAAARRMLKGAAAIHYTTRREQASVEPWLRSGRGVVIPLGLDDSVLGLAASRPSARDAKAPYILALSRLHPKKQLELLIESFAYARGAASGAWRLVIAGEGEANYVAQLRACAARRVPGGEVEFTGWVEGERKRALIGDATLFALPSMDENFGVSVLEALACGVPAVVSAHVHLADDIRDANAGWIAGLQGQEFERTLLEAMQSPDERGRRGEAAMRMAQRFAWSRIAGDLVAMYRDIVQMRANRTNVAPGDSSLAARSL